jgi:hypothetical protein
MRPFALIAVLLLCLPLGGCLFVAAGAGFVAGASAMDSSHRNGK